jgi:hypothetical protein
MSPATASPASGGCRSGSSLQADAFVTLDAELVRSVEGIVATASVDALRSG